MPEHVPIKSYVFFDCETTGLTGKRLKLTLKNLLFFSIIYYNLQNLFLKRWLWSFHLIPCLLGHPVHFRTVYTAVLYSAHKNKFII